MTTESRARVWAQRGVTIAAVLACIATSPARWTVSAKLPGRPIEGAKGALVTIEASAEPTEVARRIPGSGREIAMRREDPSTPWPGRGLYYLPPGFELVRASLTGNCAKSGMCSNCDPPPGEFVRLGPSEPVSPWSLTVTSEEQVARVNPASPSASFDVKIEAGRRVDVEATLTGGDTARFDPPFVYSMGSSPFEQTVSVNVTAKDYKTDAPAEVRWIARVTLYGYCRGEGECKPPEGERLRIVSITPR